MTNFIIYIDFRELLEILIISMALVIIQNVAGYTKLNKLSKFLIVLIFIFNFKEVEGLDLTVKNIGAKYLHDAGILGDNYSICLIDTGVDYTHPNLDGCSENEFLSGNCSRIIAGYDFGENDSNPIVLPWYKNPHKSHGTNIAGILISNHFKYKGVSPNSKLVVVKVDKDDYSLADDISNSSALSTFFNNIKLGIGWCTNRTPQYNIKAISISAGYIDNGIGYNESNCPDNFSLQSTINEAFKQGITVVFASGNNGTTNGIGTPACLKNVTSVGASLKFSGIFSNQNQIAYFTSRGSALDLLAPGKDITTTIVGGDFVVDTVSGTSFSAPYIAAVSVLLRQYDSALKPYDIEQLLKTTGKKIPDDKSPYRNYSRVDLVSALNILDWPTNRHDNRRTGTTLLKGDMRKAGDVKNYNLYLTNASNQEYVIRSSIADLDDNGYMEVVSVAHEKMYTEGDPNGILFDFERKKRWDHCPRVIPFCWENKKKWTLGLSSSVLSPPTVGNIDSTVRKEVVAPRKNSSLFVVDVGNNGETPSLLWEFIVPEQYSAIQGNSYRGELSGSAIADIDLDGNSEVIITDQLSRGAFDWPAKIYVLNGFGGHKFNATFGNGGAYGSPSIANIDEDDYPEVIVPSFYGVFAYDYNDTTNNFTKRWNNTDGLIDGEVIVYDVDKDNEYELIYSTATEGCSSQKKCYNRTYIRDAKTGVNEGPSPINYALITRVAPTIANLDNDNNLEIVTIGTNQKSIISNLGNLIAYDAKTGVQEWVFNDSNTLNVAFSSPDIADITGDGSLDIVFAENNASNVFILNKNGTLNFKYRFDAFIDNALAIGDLDSDGKAEIALKRAGSPVAFSSLSGFNEPPELLDEFNITAIAGNLVNINVSGKISALDPDGNEINYSFSSPFNSSGYWQATVNDTGNYSVMVEASDGNLTAYKFINVLVFPQESTLLRNFSDDSDRKLLNFSQAGSLTVQVRIPKNASVVYSRLKVGGYKS